MDDASGRNSQNINDEPRDPDLGGIFKDVENDPGEEGSGEMASASGAGGAMGGSQGANAVAGPAGLAAAPLAMGTARGLVDDEGAGPGPDADKSDSPDQYSGGGASDPGKDLVSDTD